MFDQADYERSELCSSPASLTAGTTAPAKRRYPRVVWRCEAGRGLEAPLRALRQWGVEHLTRTAGPDDQDSVIYDVSFVEGIDSLPDEEYELRVGPSITTLRFSDGVLVQEPARPEIPRWS